MNPDNPNLNDFHLSLGQLIKKMNLLNRNHKVCHGFTMPQCYTIEALAKKKVSTMNELSMETGVTISTMSRITDILVRDEIAIRKNSPNDRREVHVQLTPKGEEISLKLKECGIEYCMHILNNISEKDINNVVNSLKTISNAIEKVKNK